MANRVYSIFLHTILIGIIMWECCICFENSSEADSFVKSISSFVRNRDGIIVNVYSMSFTKVLFAVPEPNQEECYFYVKEKLAESILSHYKKKYIMSKLDFDINASANMNVFIQTLTCFDSDMEKKILCENIDFKDTFCIDSYVRFRMKYLKQKWNELATLANDNIMYLISEDSFVEFIKFLISNLEHRCYAVNVFSKKNCYLLCDLEGKQINDFLLEKNIAYDDNHLLTSLIALNPEKIILHCNPFLKDALLKTLYSYFMDRIELCK